MSTALNERNDSIAARIDEAHRRIRQVVESNEFSPAEKQRFRLVWDEELSRAKQDLNNFMEEIKSL